MSKAAKSFVATVERITPTQDGNRLICVKAKGRRWSLSADPAAAVREGMSITVVEAGAGRVEIAR